MPKRKKIKNLSAANKSDYREKSLPAYFFIFSTAFALFIIGPAVLGFKFTPYPLMKISDVFDLFTPLVLIPLYWLLFRMAGHGASSFKEDLAFMVFAGFWVLGQGMHLSANSIGHLTDKMTGTDIYALTNFYDETLSHYLWHFGVIGLSSVLMYRQWHNPFVSEKIVTWQNIMAGFIYGFTFFAMVIEGVTVPMGLPFAVFIVVLGLVWGRKKLEQMPLLFLFLVGYSIALVLFTAWGIWQQGFIEFSKSPDFKWLFPN